MNSEIQRLTNLRNFFIAKREACEEEIRLQQSQIKLWRESENEVDRSIAQAEKEQANASPTACGICGQPNCICNVAEPEVSMVKVEKLADLIGGPLTRPPDGACQKTRPA